MDPKVDVVPSSARTRSNLYVRAGQSTRSVCAPRRSGVRSSWRAGFEQVATALLAYWPVRIPTALVAELGWPIRYRAKRRLAVSASDLRDQAKRAVASDSEVSLAKNECGPDTQGDTDERKIRRTVVVDEKAQRPG